MRKPAARLLIAGAGSGCGKTTVTCAILQALKNRGCDLASFKCGPDYIDPMFHTEVIGAPCSNLDLFFLDEARLRERFLAHAAELNVIEGVMGCYDGLAMDSDEASSAHVARALDAPVALVIDARGMALSAAAAVRGFLELRPNTIRGVILNNISPMSYPGLKEVVERECGVRVYGYLPPLPGCALESRRLGLVTAREVAGLREKLNALAAQAERSLDLDGLIELMRAQAPLEAEAERIESVGRARIAVARDRAFCFYYRDNLELLEALGAELVEFSPLASETLPDCDGLYIGGGYPELYARELSRNRAALDSIASAVRGGLPTVAECGGFMLLCERIGEYRMAGALPAACRDAGRLSRFGYATLRAEADGLLLRAGEEIRAHEFHYWDADDPGNALTAVKPNGRSWRCGYVGEALYAGYPHLYFYSNPSAARRFVEACAERRKRREADGHRAAEL